jgi:hypothetical protein
MWRPDRYRTCIAGTHARKCKNRNAGLGLLLSSWDFIRSNAPEKDDFIRISTEDVRRLQTIGPETLLAKLEKWEEVGITIECG